MATTASCWSHEISQPQPICREAAAYSVRWNHSGLYTVGSLLLNWLLQPALCCTLWHLQCWSVFLKGSLHSKEVTGGDTCTVLVYTVLWKNSFKKMGEMLLVIYTLQKLQKCIDHMCHRLLCGYRERKQNRRHKETDSLQREKGNERRAILWVSGVPLLRSVPLASFMVFPLHQQLAHPESISSSYARARKYLPDLDLWLTRETILIQAAPSEGYTFLLLMYWQTWPGFSSWQMLAERGRSEFASPPAALEFGVLFGRGLKRTCLGVNSGWKWFWGEMAVWDAGKNLVWDFFVPSFFLALSPMYLGKL